MSLHISRPIAKLLEERGLLPKHCRNVTMTIPAADAMYLTFEVFVSTEALEILSEVFALQAKEAREDDGRNARAIAEDK